MFAAIWILLPKKFQMRLYEKSATLPGPLTDSHFLLFLRSLSFMQVPCIVAEALSRGTPRTSTWTQAWSEGQRRRCSQSLRSPRSGMSVCVVWLGRFVNWGHFVKLTLMSSPLGSILPMTSSLFRVNVSFPLPSAPLFTMGTFIYRKWNRSLLAKNPPTAPCKPFPILHLSELVSL